MSTEISSCATRSDNVNTLRYLGVDDDNSSPYPVLVRDWRLQLRNALLDVMHARGLSQKRAAAAIAKHVRAGASDASGFSESTFGKVLRGEGIHTDSIDAALSGLGLGTRLRLVDDETGLTYPVRSLVSDPVLHGGPDEPGRTPIQEQRSMRQKTDVQLELIDLAWGVSARDAEFCYDRLSAAIAERRRLHQGATDTNQT